MGFPLNNNSNISNNSLNNGKTNKLVWAYQRGHELTNCREFQLEDDEDDWKEFIQQNINQFQESEEKQMNTNFEYNDKEVKDALFGEAIVFGERINIIFDSGSKRCAIIKQFLDRKGQSIDGPPTVKLIDIHGNRVTPLGEKPNVQVNIEGIDISIDMVVTTSKDYNIILGNEWLSKVRAKMDFELGLLTITTEQGEITTPVTCWDQIKNPLQFYPILQNPISTINNYELELEEEDDQEGQTFFLNVQESPGAIKIGDELYPKECLNYWNNQLRHNDHKK